MKKFSFLRSSILFFIVFSSLSAFSQQSIDVFVRLDEAANQLKTATSREDSTYFLNVRNSRNQLIVQAFRNYTQGKVYFFYITDTKRIMAKDFNGIFVDSTSLNRDSNIRPSDSAKYVIVEFGTYVEGSTSPYGLIAYNSSMEYLKKPFPYFTSDLFGLLSYEDVVNRFDKKVNKFRLKKKARK